MSKHTDHPDQLARTLEAFNQAREQHRPWPAEHPDLPAFLASVDTLRHDLDMLARTLASIGGVHEHASRYVADASAVLWDARHRYEAIAVGARDLTSYDPLEVPLAVVRRALAFAEYLTEGEGAEA